MLWWLVLPAAFCIRNFLSVSARVLPVCLIQNDNLVPARRQGHLLLSKHLDLVSYHIYASASPEAEVHGGANIIQVVKGLCQTA